MIDCSSGDTFGVLSCQVISNTFNLKKKKKKTFLLGYRSAVWCSAAETHLKLLDRVVSGPCFLAGGVLNCNPPHRQSVAVL